MSAAKQVEETSLLATAQEVDRHLRAIREVLRRPLDAEVARGALTGPQRSVMQILSSVDSLTLKDLSKEAGLSHSTVSGIVDRLEKRGMVTRTTGEKDRRYTRIAVTQTVRDFIRDTLPGLSVHPLLDALERATGAERRTVLEGLRILRGLLVGRVDSPPTGEKALPDRDRTPAEASIRGSSDAP